MECYVREFNKQATNKIPQALPSPVGGSPDGRAKFHGVVGSPTYGTARRPLTSRVTPTALKVTSIHGSFQSDVPKVVSKTGVSAVARTKGLRQKHSNQRKTETVFQNKQACAKCMGSHQRWKPSFKPKNRC